MRRIVSMARRRIITVLPAARYNYEQGAFQAAELNFAKAITLCDRFDFSETLKWRALLNHGLALIHLD